MTDKELLQTMRSCQKARNCTSCEALPNCQGVEELLYQAADRLEALLAENEHLREVTKMIPKWVSVDERLPELAEKELVHCEDCRHRSQSVNSPKNAVWCREFGAYMCIDDFCSYGERKKG